MHPVLANTSRLGLYLVIWALGGALLAGLLVQTGGAALGWTNALILAVPLMLLEGFICLAAWHICRVVPLQHGAALRVVGTHALAAAISSSIWLLAARGWAAALAAAPRFSGAADQFTRAFPVLFIVGVLLFSLAAAVQYLLIAFEASREAERSALQLTVQAREAELKALRAQLDPHFLFNSLNSISALASSDPAGARRMCLLLGDYFRKSLSLGSREYITIGQELSLVDDVLAIEKVRFGARLSVVRRVDPAAEPFQAPPLLLQPLVENAVKHGVASLIEGGAITIEVAIDGARLLIVVENPRDADGRSRPGAGMGLDNVRQRLASRYGHEARVHVRESPDSFRVELTLPARRADEKSEKKETKATLESVTS